MTESPRAKQGVPIPPPPAPRKQLARPSPSAQDPLPHPFLPENRMQKFSTKRLQALLNIDN